MNRVKLYVGNIPYTTDEESLRQAFTEQGCPPVGVRLVTDRETGQPRGFAFVELATQAEGDAAIAALDGANYGGRTMRVSYARERERGPGGGGGGGGMDRGGAGYDRGNGPPRGGRPPRTGGYGGGGGGGYGGYDDRGRDDGDDGGGRGRRRGGGRY